MSFLVTVPGGIVIDTNSVDAFLNTIQIIRTQIYVLSAFVLPEQS